MNNKSVQTIKQQLHVRNKHRNGYDFVKLIQILPELSNFVKKNQYGNLSIDFADPQAVKILNKALLLCFYQLTYWDIPENYLCPPIPGRADYIHYLADLLAQDYNGIIPNGNKIKVLDIGVGANAIYPIIGHAEYGWSFIASDVNPVSIKIANLIVESNQSLKGALQCRLQKNSDKIFENIIKPKEYFALTLCNPPFHNSPEQAQAGTKRKLKNLAKSSQNHQVKSILNFGGQHAELWCEGGESAFISKMIDESQNYKHQCLWFSSLVSKKETLPIISKKLEQINTLDVQIINMAQGQKISRFVAWSFKNKTEREQILVNLINKNL